MQNPHIVHGVENAPVHGLQPVAYVGQRASDTPRHRIVEIRPPHLLFDIDGLNIRGAGNAAAVSASGRRSQGKLWVLIVSHFQFSVPSSYFDGTRNGVCAISVSHWNLRLLITVCL